MLRLLAQEHDQKEDAGPVLYLDMESLENVKANPLPSSSITGSRRNSRALSPSALDSRFAPARSSAGAVLDSRRSYYKVPMWRSRTRVLQFCSAASLMHHDRASGESTRKSRR